VSLDQTDLVQRARAGDTLAFRELFRVHRADVARLAHRLLGSPSDLEDVVQDVFLQVHRSIRDFRGQARFSTWLYRVTVNVVLMSRRAARSRPAFVESAEPHVINQSDERALPDEQVSRHLRIQAFRRLLDRLSEKKRTVYVLHELQGVPPTEIAEIVGAPVLTVRTRLFYARRELQQMLHDEPALATLAREFGEIEKGSGDE
jgi:RNA polymerase sigma-70 factor (ECF subfamily)